MPQADQKTLSKKNFGANTLLHIKYASNRKFIEAKSIFFIGYIGYFLKKI